MTLPGSRARALTRACPPCARRRRERVPHHDSIRAYGLALLAWVKRHRADPARVMFFLHPMVDVEVLRPWRDAGHGTDRVDVVDSWRRLHRLLGLALDDRVYEDWARRKAEKP